jgi:hypothetical protein
MLTPEIAYFLLHSMFSRDHILDALMAKNTGLTENEMLISRSCSLIKLYVSLQYRLRIIYGQQ